MWRDVKALSPSASRAVGAEHWLRASGTWENTSEETAAKYIHNPHFTRTSEVYTLWLVVIKSEYILKYF